MEKEGTMSTKAFF